MSSSVVSVSFSSTAPLGTTFADVACVITTCPPRTPRAKPFTTLHIELPARGPH